MTTLLLDVVRRCRIGRLAAALLVLFLVGACSSPEEKEAQHVERGMALYEQHDDAKAMIELRNALRLNPKNADALYYVGLIHERAERWPQAFGAFQAAAAERPGFKNANMKLGTLSLIGNQLEVAEKAAQSILEHHPDDLDGRVLEAAVMLRKSDLQRAEDIAREVLAQQPTHENAVAVLAGVYSARGRNEEALTILDESIQRLPKSSALRLIKIAILEKQNDVQGIIDTYGKLFELEPDNVQFRLALANFHVRHQDLKNAEGVLREAVESDVGTSTMGPELVGLVYRERGLEAAKVEIDQLLERDPEAQSLRFLLADYYIRENRIEESEKTLREILDKAPSEETKADARSALARLKLAQNDLPAAKALLDEVLTDNPDHRGANLVRGLIHLAQGETDEAIRSGRTALRRDPAWVPGLKLVAEGHLKKGEADLAMGALKEIVAASPDETASAETLARLLTERNDLDAALKVWDVVINHAKDPSHALQARAEIRIEQKNWTAAQQDIGTLLQTPGQEVSGSLLAGNLMMAQHRPEQGRDWYSKALAMSPDAVRPLIGVVQTYVAQNDLEGAQAYLAKRTATQPEDAVAQNLLGELLVRKGKNEEAEHAFREAIKLQPRWVTPSQQLAVLLRQEGRIDDSISIYEAALSENPGNTKLLTDLATTKLLDKRYQPAIEDYRRVLAVEPGNEVAVNNYAALVADHHEEDQASLDQALQLAQIFRTSDNPWFLDTLGWLYYRKGDYPVAATFLDRAVSHQPDEPQFRYHLGMALYKSGQQERARLELSKAVGEAADYLGVEEARATLALIEKAEKPEKTATKADG